jgi:hypothetical protein
MSNDTDPTDVSDSGNMKRALIQQSTKPVTSVPDLECSLLVPNSFTQHYQQACCNGVTPVNSQDPSQLNEVIHHATAAYSTLSDVLADQTMAHYKLRNEHSDLQGAYINKSMECDRWRTLYEQSQGINTTAQPPVQHPNNFPPAPRPIKVDVGTLNLNILGRELPLCIPGIPMSATAPSSVPKPPKYREPCDRDPSTDTRRSCKFLHPDQTELYAHLIPNLPWNAESESGPNDDEMEE